MPVYYGGDLCDSDDSEWDDPWDLAHGEHVERYNFDALDGMELKVFERLKAVNEPTMSEVPGRGPISQDLNAPQVEADRLESAGIGELLTEGSDVGGIAKSPIHRTSVTPRGGVTTFYYEGDLSDSVVFSDKLLWENDIAESSHMLPDDGQPPVSTSPILAGTIVPLEFPDSDRAARWDDDGLEALDRRFSEFSVLPWGTEDKFGISVFWMGMRWVLAQVMMEYYMMVRSGYAYCSPPPPLGKFGK